jgi:hypothetical protein
MNKRVTGQYHLTLHTCTTYNALPLSNCANGFVGEYLEKLSCTIMRSTKTYSKVFAVRVDLRFPQYYAPYDAETFSNEYLHHFIRALRCRLQHYKAGKQQAGQRVHNLKFEYVWAREYGPSSDRPHFHLLLLFNGNAFNSLGHFSNNHESLYNRIGESWGESLGIHVAEGCKFCHFPEIGQYLIDSKNFDQVAQLFHRASYLAKVETKNFHDGFHVFGGSRL